MVTNSSWETVAALVDPVRRGLYEYVSRQEHPVTREEAADAVAISRNLAAFHLDKLVEIGILRARYESPADKRRGRGRTPKVYEAAGDGLDLTVPPRRYELIARILSDAVAEGSVDAGSAATRHAFDYGRHLGQSCPARRRGAAEMVAVQAALTDLGFQPQLDQPQLDAELSLRNCPFHTVAQRQPGLICGLNAAFVDGLLVGLEATGLHARLQPKTGSCCVRVTPVPAS